MNHHNITENIKKKIFSEKKKFSRKVNLSNFLLGKKKNSRKVNLSNFLLRKNSKMDKTKHDTDTQNKEKGLTNETNETNGTNEETQSNDEHNVIILNSSKMINFTIYIKQIIFYYYTICNRTTMNIYK